MNVVGIGDVKEVVIIIMSLEKDQFGQTNGNLSVNAILILIMVVQHQIMCRKISTKLEIK